MTFTLDLLPLTEAEISSSFYAHGLGDFCSHARKVGRG